MRARATAIFWVVSTAAVVGKPITLLAADTYWTNATGNSQWADPGNWTDGVPTAPDRAYIHASGTIVLPATPVDVDQILRVTGSAAMFPVEIAGGQINTRAIQGALSNTVISSDVGALGDALSLFGVTLNGRIADRVGGGSFELRGSSVTLRAASSHTGPSVLSLVVLEDTGSVASSNRIDVGVALTLNASAMHPAVNRLPDDAPLKLSQATLLFNAGTVSTGSEATGTLVIDAGRSEVRLEGPLAGSLVFIPEALSRSPGAVLHLTTNPTSKLRFIQAPTGANASIPTDRDVLGWGVGTIAAVSIPRWSFLTYDAGPSLNDPTDDPGLRPLHWDTDYATSIAAGGNVRLSGTQALQTNSAVRSLNLVNAGLQLEGTTLTIEDGLLLQGDAGASVSGTGAIHFTEDAVLLAFGTSNRHVVGVAVQGSHLTKGGDGELVLEAANAIAGGVHVSGGTLTSRAAGALGTGSVTLAGGVLRVEGQAQSVQHLTLNSSATLSTGAGASLTVHQIEGRFLSLTGDGALHLPTGNPDLSVTMYGGELHSDGTLDRVLLRQGRLTGAGEFDTSIQAYNDRAVIAPGPGVATISTRSLSLGESLPSTVGPILQLDLLGTEPGVTHDQIVVTASAQISSILFDLNVGYPAQLGDAFTVIDIGFGSSTGFFSNLPEGSTFVSGGYEFQITYRGGTGNDVVLTVVPEPAAAGVVIVGVGMLMLARRRGRARHSGQRPVSVHRLSEPSMRSGRLG